MKKIFFAIFAVAALASCMQDEIVSFDKGDAIAFNNAFVSNATKAIDPSITTDSISEFYVYGTTQGDHDANAPIVNIFPGIRVQKEAIAGGVGKSGTWYYAGDCVQYWIDGNKYKFAAVAGVDKATIIADATTGMPATINYNANNQADLLYAETNVIEGQKSGNNAVAFTFKHLLSKAVFEFENTTATDDTSYMYQVTNVMISNLKGEAVYTVGETTPWDSLAGDYDAVFGDIVENGTAVSVKPGNKYLSNYERLLIPGTHENVTISCTITLYKDVADANHVVDVIDYVNTRNLTFEAGVAYKFVLTAGLEDKIKFTVTEVKGWNNPYTPVTPTTQPDHDNIPDQNN